MGPHILVIEDDESIGSALERTLESNGHEVVWTRNGTDGLAAAERLAPALVLLDLGLPDVDGVDVCREIRTRLPDAAIVILTARHDEIDVVVGLDAGANDYVTKPFRLAELLARVRAQLRHTTTNADEVTAGDLLVDLGARRAFAGGVEIDLRPREFDLLALLVGEAGHALTRERIMHEVWDEHWFGSTKTLDVHISSLRRKLAAGSGAERPLITALRNVGYRLDVP